MCKKLFLLILIFMVLGSASSAMAGTVVLELLNGNASWVEANARGGEAMQQITSTYISNDTSSGNPGTNYCVAMHKFDLSGAGISSGSVIISATLHVDFDGQVRNGGAEASTIRCYELLTDFTNETTIHSDWAAGADMWGTQGTDYGNTELFNVAVSASSNPGAFDKDVTAQVASWHSGSATVTGFYFRMDDPSSDGENAQKLDSNAYTADPRHANAPYLTVVYGDAIVASGPSPSQGAIEQALDVDLSWDPGTGVQDTNGHVVYFGTSEADVTDANGSNKLGVWMDPNDVVADGNRFKYDPGTLVDSTTYYWRVDEINDTNSSSPWVGSVWNFTTIFINRFASNLTPVDEATGQVANETVLSWDPGETVQAVKGHVVYFGTNETNVTDSNGSNKLGVWMDPNDVVADGGRFSYDPGILGLNTTYYWRVDEVNTADGNSPWSGSVVSFTTDNSLIVDDFEDYNTLTGSGTNVFDTWADGYDDESSGSSVNGSTVTDPNGPANNSSVQSMYLQYSSSGTHPDTTQTVPYYSQVIASASDLDGGTDWSSGGAIKAIGLYFYGTAGNDANETMYFGLEDGDGNYAEVRYGSAFDEDMNDVRDPNWHPWNISLDDYIVAGVNTADVNKVYIGFDDSVKASRGATAGAAGTSIIFIDDITLFAQRCVPAKIVGNYDDNCIIDYDDLKVIAGSWLTDGSLPATWESGMDADPVTAGLLEVRSGTSATYAMTTEDSRSVMDIQADHITLDPVQTSSNTGDMTARLIAKAKNADGVILWLDMWPNGAGESPSTHRAIVNIWLQQDGGDQAVRIEQGTYKHATDFVWSTGYDITKFVDVQVTYDQDANTFDWTATDGTFSDSGNDVPYTASAGGGGGGVEKFTLYSTGTGLAYVDYFKVSFLDAVGDASADLTGDDLINFDDFAVQANQWYETQLWPFTP